MSLLGFSFHPRFLIVLTSDYQKRRYSLTYKISPILRESLHQCSTGVYAEHGRAEALLLGWYGASHNHTRREGVP
jgi:hypothetical protein